MNLQCSNCGTVYDISDYEAGHRFTCTCGQALEVGAAPPAAAVSHSTPPIAESATGRGLATPLKLLVFFGNLCGAPVVPIVAFIAWLLLRDDSPALADDVCKMTWIPFVLWIILFGLYMVFAVSMGLLGSLGSMGQGF